MWVENVTSDLEKYSHYPHRCIGSRKDAETTRGEITESHKNKDMKKVIRMWSAVYGNSISESEAREIIRNITGFFDTLARWGEEG
jgi:hypothetical protein